MKIAVIDDSKFYLKIVEKMLKKAGFEEYFLFYDEDDILEFLSKNKVDVVIVDYVLTKIDGITLSKKIRELVPSAIIIMLTSAKEEDIKRKALEEGIDEFVNKDITFPEFVAKMKMINKLVELLENERERRKKLREELDYAQNQEKLAFIKYHKVVKNELSMYFDNEKYFESFYKPRDILNGDAIFSKRLGDNKYLIAIIDAMGKGVHASLTSLNVVSFLEHSLNKAIEFNDFNFHKLINDLIDYTKNILLEKEILCTSILCIDKDKLRYANFGMPPIYTEAKNYVSNNSPITQRTKEYTIDEVNLPKFFYILSDGLLESPLKDNKGLYFMRLKKLLLKNLFIREIIKDFNNLAIQGDDISIFHFFQQPQMQTFKKFVYNIAEKNDIDKILLEVQTMELPQKNKFIYILQELLMNVVTHALKDGSVKLEIEFKKYFNYIVMCYKEDSAGFDLNILHELELDKYHGRGIKIMKNLADGLFFNKTANEVKIFIKEI